MTKLDDHITEDRAAHQEFRQGIASVKKWQHTWGIGLVVIITLYANGWLKIPADAIQVSQTAMASTGK